MYLSHVRALYLLTLLFLAAFCAGLIQLVVLQSEESLKREYQLNALYHRNVEIINGWAVASFEANRLAAEVDGLKWEIHMREMERDRTPF